MKRTKLLLAATALLLPFSESEAAVDYAKIDRTIPPDAPLHETVLRRFATREVQLYDVFGPYRPEGLRKHKDTAGYY